jgi:glycosyltransferase involved in cell wall biosynthesis
VMTTGGVAADTLLPQCLWMPERADPPKGGNSLPLYTMRLEESLRRAAAFFCYSTPDRDWLVAKDAKVAAKGVTIHPLPLESVTPLSAIDRERVKAEFAGGREYFLADAKGAGEEELVLLLKAFSLFKKRQHSNLQLVVKGLWTGGLQTKLETYKYKDEVHGLPDSGDNDGRLTAGAYAGIFLFDKTSLGTPILNAWKAGTPVIGDAGNPLLAGVEDAVLTADASDPTSLSAHLMSVYKDEALRNRLIDRGRTRLAEWDGERTIVAVWSAIDKNCPIIS